MENKVAKAKPRKPTTSTVHTTFPSPTLTLRGLPVLLLLLITQLIINK